MLSKSELIDFCKGTTIISFKGLDSIILIIFIFFNEFLLSVTIEIFAFMFNCFNLIKSQSCALK